MLILLLAALADWPAWRGADMQGISREAALPSYWSRTENVRWKIDLPEPGNSTPIVWGDRIFLTQALTKENRRTVMSLDRATGKLQWQTGVTFAKEDPTHRTNPLASGSPVTDGERVYAWFGSAGVAAWDFNGREVWRRDLGRQHHVWGYGSSPIVHGDLLILNHGPGDPSFLIALDKKTGRTVWKVDYPGVRPDAEMDEAGADGRGPKRGVVGNSGAGPADYYGSWGTPVVIRAGGRDELIVHLPKRVTAFDPKTGRELWTCGGLSDLVYTSPMWGEGIIVSLGSFGGASLAVRPGGTGDVTATHRVWHTPRSKPRLGTGVIREGHIYTHDISGIAECLELRTGKPVWTQRLRGAESDATWASMLLHGNRIYLLNQTGDTFVLKASPQFEMLGRSSLNEASNSSVVPTAGGLLIRTHAALWSIGEPRR